MSDDNKKIEFGDFQTPAMLAEQVCIRLKKLGLCPNSIVEPTCGVGAFVISSANNFPSAERVLGFEINERYIEELEKKTQDISLKDRVVLERADFFNVDWAQRLGDLDGELLVLGNLPWVTNSTQGSIGSTNLPEKSNFLGFSGFDAISGKSNFDISEWMLLDLIKSLHGRKGDIAMLVKTAVARKVLAQAERQKSFVKDSIIIEIDAKKYFDASVDACLLLLRLDPSVPPSYDYTVFDDMDSEVGRRVGHRMNMTVGNLEVFQEYSYLIGKSPQKWRSGVKHDSSSVMEFTRVPGGYKNGFDEVVELEENYIFPLMKGSDVGGSKVWREKFVLITQRFVGEGTDEIRNIAPLTYSYLIAHGEQLDARGSVIYKKNPRFSIFGVGDYAFLPWRIAICALYKKLNFRMIGPIDGKPVMFDDTVYYLSFSSELEAVNAYKKIQSEEMTKLLSSLIFWDEKRPIKTSILNAVDWSLIK